MINGPGPTFLSGGVSPKMFPSRFEVTMDDSQIRGQRDTGLSKSGLTLEAERARRYQAHLSVLLIDMDGLSLVNGSLGRAAGDALIQAVSELIRSNLRRIDVFGRWSPEDYLVLTVDPNAHGSIALAEKLRKTIAQATFSVLGQEVRITVSIGVARGNPRDEAGVDALIEAARGALVKAKAEGRNRVAFQAGDLLHLPAPTPRPGRP